MGNGAMARSCSKFAVAFCERVTWVVLQPPCHKASVCGLKTKAHSPTNQAANALNCNAGEILDTGARRDIKRTCGGRKWPANNDSLPLSSSWKRCWKC